jgi:tryptophanyl-tRNA synthetase
MTDLSKDVQGLKLEGEPVKVAPANAATAHSQNVTPWEVEGAVVDGIQQAIDYNKLIEQFGTRPIDEALLERFEKLTGRKPHIFLRRGTFFSHR